MYFCYICETEIQSLKLNALKLSLSQDAQFEKTQDWLNEVIKILNYFVYVRESSPDNKKQLVSIIKIK